MPKAYDRTYFERWYRSPDAVVKPEVVRRKVRLALSAAEYVLGREVRSVLDVGCGEAPWRAELKRLRPRLRYLGVDSSPYVVRRFGRRRNIVAGSLGTLDRLRLTRPFDLVVCADVLEYVPTGELRTGLRNLAALTAGMAYIEAFPFEDDMVGDMEDWHHRSAATYRREFRRAGFTPCGLHCYVTRSSLPAMGALEICVR